MTVCFIRAAKLRNLLIVERIIEGNRKNVQGPLYMICQDLIDRELSLSAAQNIIHSFYRKHSQIANAPKCRFFLDEFEIYKKSGKEISNVMFDSTDHTARKHAANLQNTKMTEIDIECPTSCFIENHSKMKRYHGVVLGGTFDKMHYGHELLLTISAYLAENKIVIGITDDDYVQKRKILPEFIDTAKCRVHLVKNYVQSIHPSLKEVIVESMNDGFGPSIREVDLDAIVVSPETLKGGQAVVAKRKELGLCNLEIEQIEILDDRLSTESSVYEEKISSSNQRKQILGTRIAPSKKTKFKSESLIIGVTGGIACGKSALTEKIVNMFKTHFEVIAVDCDKLAHLAYESGSDCFEQIIQSFGKDVLMLNSVGSQEINRQVLGQKVFGDHNKLKKLNEIVWPEVRKQVENIIKKNPEKGKIIVVEAALLIEAEWADLCEEIFTCIVPKQMALERLSTRNPLLSAEEALSRIESQISNRERIEHSTFVFSTQWDHDFTLHQLTKAFSTIKHELLL